MKNKKEIELKVVYDNIIDNKYIRGWIEVNGKKVKESGRITMGTTLDILEHLGYCVTFITPQVTKEKL
jgi:hypothetical protein